ncbi:MAG: helix-turn-helix domain-containing protein [Patescibacteria group bacterium]
MKNLEKQKAVALRQKGESVKHIAKTLGVSKGSVSLWVRNVELTRKQIAKLKDNSHTTVSIEKRRVARLKNESQKRQFFIDRAKKDIKKISRNDLMLIGTALYWAEGRKRGKRILGFSNSDPSMIKIMMKFFRTICKVKENRFRGHIHTHSHLNAKTAEKFWSEVSKIPLDQFHKTYFKPSKSSAGKMDGLPYGTFDIYVYDVALFLKVQGWTEKIKELIIRK